jgi:GT2 family glycosyltransferase
MMDDLAVGGEFWENLFFMYGDDLDIDWRAAMRGWKCLYWPAALAYHVGSGTRALKRDRVYAMFVAHRYLMVLKNDRPADLARDAPWFLGATAKEAARLLFTRPMALLQALGVFCRKAVPCLRRRRKIQKMRTHGVRPWFDLSLRLIRESRT